MKKLYGMKDNEVIFIACGKTLHEVFTKAADTETNNGDDGYVWTTEEIGDITTDTMTI